MAEIVMKNQALSQQIYHILKKEILHHKLLPGEQIVDTQIAVRFGVSRTPARDAIFQLVRCGLVEKAENSRYYVLLAKHKDIDEIYEIREIIEKAIINQVIDKLEDGDCEIQERVASWRERYLQGVAEHMIFSEVDLRMHNELIGMTDNARLLKIYKESCNLMILFRENTDEHENRIQVAHLCHLRMIDGICSKNRGEALAAIHDHIALALSEAHELLNEQ